jgi:anti-anti-sigma regulatory factor
MNFSQHPVIVKEFPSVCDGGKSRKFLHELKLEMSHAVRPSVVLDCSRASRVDRQTLHLFLCCLEEAMKRNGDVRLAGLHREALPVLRATAVERLFRNFSTTAEAIDSYRRPAIDRTAFTVEVAIDETEANAA